MRRDPSITEYGGRAAGHKLEGGNVSFSTYDAWIISSSLQIPGRGAEYKIGTKRKFLAMFRRSQWPETRPFQ